MKRSIIILVVAGAMIASIVLAITLPKNVETNRSLVDYVNPYMGNISHILVPTFPTVHLPNSMMRAYPVRKDFTSDKLHGLPILLTSHRGSFAFNLSPYQGDLSYVQPIIDYTYDNEKITPYSYEVDLDEYQIDVKFGLSHQSAAYQLEFTKDAEKFIIINSENGELHWDGSAISGYQVIENDTKVYLYLVPETVPEKVLTINNAGVSEISDVNGRNANLILQFAQGNQVVELKYGVSFIDEAQALANFTREIKDKDLLEIQNLGKDIWNKTLQKITVEGDRDEDLSIFYSSFYRTLERPIAVSEDGRYYSPFDRKVHDDNGQTFYTDDWIWDSYRAHHPLNCLIEPDKEANIVNSLVTMAWQMEKPWMPTFPKITGDSRSMNSNHGVATVLDAYRKGIRGFDIEKAYLACKGAITEKTLAPWSGMPAGELDVFYVEKGFFPALNDGEGETAPEVHHFESRQPVAVTLGTSYDEWCLGQIAKELNLNEDAKIFTVNSYNYRNLFNESTKFFHPKNDQGEFIEPFDYVFSGGMGARKFYDENNGWTYRWDVQHNVMDLIDLMGGSNSFIEELDGMFSEPLGRSKYAFYAQLPDQTGNVGQFSMANEPSLHIPYLYNFAGQPWKTQKRIRTLIDQWFRNDLMGVPGDEDGGGMSAFVVFSQLGFYPVTPGLPVYNIGSPVFENASIDLGNGNKFLIEVKNYSPNHKYIQSAKLNGVDWNKPWFSHEDIIDGANLELVMGEKANINWGSDLSSPPSHDN